MTVLEPKIVRVKRLVTSMAMFLLMSMSIFIFATTNAEANTGREFTTSVIYGTLAGALVGAATLAFTSNPGDNLNNVARGASYGLYAGILLGVYVTYGVSDSPPPNPDGTQQPSIENLPPSSPSAPPPQEQKSPDQSPGSEGSLKINHALAPRIALYPVLPANSFHDPRGWGIGLQLVNFQF